MHPCVQNGIHANRAVVSATTCAINGYALAAQPHVLGKDKSRYQQRGHAQCNFCSCELIRGLLEPASSPSPKCVQAKLSKWCSSLLPSPHAPLFRPLWSELETTHRQADAF